MPTLQITACHGRTLTSITQATFYFTDYNLPWEDPDFHYPGNFAPPLEIAIEASNGASDYGNKFGEPVLAGFARSYGMVLPDGERREYIKPIMFSGGIGQLEGSHIKKEIPEKGLDNIYIRFGTKLYRQIVGILMGTNCAPLVADLFLFCYERDFMTSLSDP